MDLFHVIDDAVVILRKKGLYRQAKVFRRGEQVFAQAGSAFIRLSAYGGTSDPSTSWIELEAAGVEQRAGQAPIWTTAANEDRKVA